MTEQNRESSQSARSTSSCPFERASASLAEQDCKSSSQPVSPSSFESMECMLSSVAEPNGKLLSQSAGSKSPRPLEQPLALMKDPNHKSPPRSTPFSPSEVQPSGTTTLSDIPHLLSQGPRGSPSWISPLLQGTSDFPPASAGSTQLLPSRWGIDFQELSGNVQVVSVFLRAHASFQEAFDDAKTSAQKDMSRLAEEAKMAGKPPGHLDIFDDIKRRNVTVAVDNVFRLRYQVDPIYDDVGAKSQGAQSERHVSTAPSDGGKASSEIEQTMDNHAPKSPYGLNTDTEVKSSEVFMKIKQEFDASSSATLLSYPTPAPEDAFVSSGGTTTTVNQQRGSTNQALIEILEDGPETPVENGDTVANNNDLFDESNNSGEDIGTVLPGSTEDQSTTPIIGAEADTNVPTSPQNTPLGIQTQATVQEIDPDAGASHEAQAVTEDSDPAIFNSTGEQAAMNDMEPKRTYGSNNFGLYITISNPPAAPATYRIQLNTSLGQAESDMKVIVGNELTKAIAKGSAEDLHLVINENKIEVINNKKGSRLIYEVVKGDFVDGKFRSEMEVSGRVTDGESYTKKKMEESLAGLVQNDNDGENSEMRATDETEAGAVETPIDTSKTTDVAPSRERTRSPNTEAESVKSIQYDDSEQEAPVVPPSKKRRLNSVQAVQGKAHDEHNDNQKPSPAAPRTRKRTRKPENTAKDQQDHTGEAVLEPSPKKRKQSSSDDAKGSDDEVLTDADTIFCRCKQSDDGRKMFACDGEQCANNGWVHLACVPEVTVAPEDDDGDSKWLCPDCDPEAFEKSKGKKGGAGKKKSVGKRGRGAANKKRFAK